MPASSVVGMRRECLPGVRIAAIAAVAIGSTGCSLVLDFSESAIPGDATPDSPFSDVECQLAEPNNSAAEAIVFDPAVHAMAAVCQTSPGVDDRDFYRFTVAAGITMVTVRIDFTSSPTGDLDLRLYDGTGTTVLGSSVGFADTEQIVCPGTSPLCNQNMPLPEGDYLFEVFPAIAGAANRYSITLSQQ